MALTRREVSNVEWKVQAIAVKDREIVMLSTRTFPSRAQAARNLPQKSLGIYKDTRTNTYVVRISS